MGTDAKDSELENNGELDKIDRFTTDFPIAVVFVMEKDANPNMEEGILRGGAYGTVIGAGVSLVGIAVLGPVGIAGTIAAFTVGGSSVGYLIGSDTSAEWDARILIWDYDRLGELSCNSFESKSTPLEVVQKE